MSSLGKEKQQWGALLWPANTPSAGQKIQLTYDNNFGSIWEYSDAFESGKIDGRSFAGKICPICKGRCGYREIPGYYRKVIDLFPFREGRIGILRFLCRKLKLTFSLLPHQLIPFVHYTARSVLLTLAIAHQHHEKMGLFSVAEQIIDENAKVTGHLIACWLVIACRSRLLSGDKPRHPGAPRGGQVDALRRVSAALRPKNKSRDPPPQDARLRHIDHLLKEFAQSKKTFPLGVASQDRPVSQHRCA